MASNDLTQPWDKTLGPPPQNYVMDFSKDAIDVYGKDKAPAKPALTKAPAKVTAAPKKAQLIKPKGYSDQDIMGMIDDESPATMTAKNTQAITKQTEMMQTEADRKRTSAGYLAAARFGLDVMNANSAYAAVKGAAALNLSEAKRQSADAMMRGEQRALEARGEAQHEGESALLALAAQGQDVQGANAQKVVSSLDAMGAQNAMQEELTALGEALGFNLEGVAINYQLDQAETNRNMSILSSALQYGASTL